MNGFVGLNDMMKNINQIQRRKDVVRQWFLECFSQAFAKEDPEQDNA